jgi:hypothetical protein
MGGLRFEVNPDLLLKTSQRVGGMAQVVEHLSPEFKLKY